MDALANGHSNEKQGTAVASAHAIPAHVPEALTFLSKPVGAPGA